ncbi:MAG: glycosyltransferase [Lachnospiraceae bacterium]|nr:glycosyltransferase [Lachnospiraceae bacterium]
MTILHICGVQNKMSNGATVAVIEHVNAQSKTGLADIEVLHVRDEKLSFDEAVQVVKMEQAKMAIAQADLLVFHELYYISFISLASYAKRVGTPYIVIPHGALTVGAQTPKKCAKIVVNGLWARSYIEKAAAVQFLSNSEKETSLKWNYKSFIAPNGVSLPADMKVYNTQYAGLKLVFIGRLNLFHKGLDALVDACDLIRDEMLSRNIRLDIYGPIDGDNGGELVKLVSDKSLQDVVSIHDSVFGRDKMQAMMDADVFIQTSRFEGMPMGLLGAMAAGLPLIVTPGTNFDQAVEDNDCGWICQTDAGSIAHAIIEAADDKISWPIKSINAREFVKNNFEWSRVASDTISKYKEYV